MNIHQHDMSTFLACRMKYKLSKIDGWRPKKLSKHLSIGGLFHEAVRILHENGTVPECWSHIDKIEDQLLQNVTSQAQVDGIETNRGILHAMTVGYDEYFMKFNEIYPEYTVNVPVLGYRYINTLDGRIVEGKRNSILEIKTTTTIPTDTKANLPTNFQIKSYFWSLGKWLRKPVNGIVYRWVKKPSIRQKKTETLEEYRKRLLLEYCTEKEKYFYEERIYFDKNILKDFEKELYQQFRDLKDAYKTKRWYKEPTVCHDYGGCQFLPYCNTMDKDVLKTFYEKEEV